MHTLSGYGENERFHGLFAGVLACAVELAFCFVHDRHVLTLRTDAGRIAVIICNRLAAGDDDGAVTESWCRKSEHGDEWKLGSLIGP
ncbi:hypothetical protein Q6283_28015, partial [Klebsiella pneumoniae]|uniref:hypothetical protein n=1 Tax=Klebsiella pneumoniae TaxID=573 RepID=UPI00273117EB